jgi:hypothetical protein
MRRLRSFGKRVRGSRDSNYPNFFFSAESLPMHLLHAVWAKPFRTGAATSTELLIFSS